MSFTINVHGRFESQGMRMCARVCADLSLSHPPRGFATVSESNCRQQAERCPNLWKRGSREERTIKVTGRRWKWGHSPCVSKTSPLAAAPPATSLVPSAAVCRSAAISSDACGSFSGPRFPGLDAGGAQGCSRWERCRAGLGPRWLSLMADLERQTLPGTNCSAT